MTLPKTFVSAIAVSLALSSLASAASLAHSSDSSLSVSCEDFGPAEEFYYKESGHSSPLWGVQTNASTGVLTAVNKRDTNQQFQFRKCDATSTGYIQGQPITQGYSPEYFGHVVDVASSKCLKHRSDSRDFVLDTCPTANTADAQLPFWFESPSATNSVIRFTGYKNTTAYPQPVWFETTLGKTAPFAIKTLKDAQHGKPNQYVLARPIRT